MGNATTQDRIPTMVDEPKFRPKRYPVPGGLIWHHSATHWVAKCHVCPKRIGRADFQDRKAADAWFANHLAPESVHWKVRYDKGAREAEEAMLREIFSKGK